MSGMSLVDMPDSAGQTPEPYKKGHKRGGSKDFVAATPAEFVKKSGGDFVIEKVKGRRPSA